MKIQHTTLFFRIFYLKRQTAVNIILNLLMQAADNILLFPIGVQAFAEALLIIVKVLAQNSGLDPQEAIVKLQQEYMGPQPAVGLDIKTGIFLSLAPSFVTFFRQDFLFHCHQEQHRPKLFFHVRDQNNILLLHKY